MATPETTPLSAADRLRAKHRGDLPLTLDDLNIAVDRVLYKISRVYDVPSTICLLPPEPQDKPEQHKPKPKIIIPEKELDNLKKKCQEVTQNNPDYENRRKTYAPENLEKSEIDETARAIMLDLMKGFYLRGQIPGNNSGHPARTTNGPTPISIRKHPEGFDNAEGRIFILDTYINHLTCRGMEQLKNLGFSEINAYKFTGHLIRQSIAIYTSTMPDYSSACVRPKLGRPATAGLAAIDAAKVRDYWRVCRDSINKACYPEKGTGRT